MATGYIVWDPKNKVVIAGPFATSGEATTAIARAFKNKSGGNKNLTANFTTETVTI